MLDLGKFLPYLVNRCGVRLAANFSKILKPYGIGIQEWRVLAALYANGGQRMSALAELTSIDRTTLSRLTARMDGAGLVARNRTDDDGREVRVSLTGKGREITSQLLPSAHRYEEVAVRGFSPDEIAKLKQMLDRVYDNLDRL